MHTLINSWIQLWNGDYAAADGLISDDFTVHAAMLDGGDGSAVTGREALVAWIRQTRAALPDLRFTTAVGPLVDGDHLAIRWRAHGTYGGGMPDATAPIGTPIDFTGTDTLRVYDGRLAEYWVNSDIHVLRKQLHVLPA